MSVWEHGRGKRKACGHSSNICLCYFITGWWRLGGRNTQFCKSEKRITWYCGVKDVVKIKERNTQFVSQKHEKHITSTGYCGAEEVVKIRVKHTRFASQKHWKTHHLLLWGWRLLQTVLLLFHYHVVTVRGRNSRFASQKQLLCTVRRGIKEVWGNE